MAPFVFGITGWAGSGKTSLLDALVPELRRRGYRVGTIRHDPAGLSADWPGTDTWRHRLAGAQSTLLLAPGRLTLYREGDDQDPNLWVSLLGEVDVVLAEGFAEASWPKLEVYEGQSGRLLNPGDPWLVACVGHVKPQGCPVPFFMPDEVDRIVDIIEATQNLGQVANR